MSHPKIYSLTRGDAFINNENDEDDYDDDDNDNRKYNVNYKMALRNRMLWAGVLL